MHFINKKGGYTRPGESDRHPISQETPAIAFNIYIEGFAQPHNTNQQIERKNLENSRRQNGAI